MAQLSNAARVLFAGANYAHIATVLPSGAPHSVPIWVDVEGDRVAFLTDPTSRKARNIVHDPRVAISITRHDNPFDMAQVRGRVIERVEGERAWTIIDRISQKYTGRPYGLRTDRVVFLVEPDFVWQQKFG
jgi:PPOX class probable F420-dependent enzyme